MKSLFTEYYEDFARELPYWNRITLKILKQAREDPDPLKFRVASFNVSPLGYSIFVSYQGLCATGRIPLDFFSEISSDFSVRDPFGRLNVVDYWSRSSDGGWVKVDESAAHDLKVAYVLGTIVGAGGFPALYTLVKNYPQLRSSLGSVVGETLTSGYRRGSSVVI